MQAGFGLPRIGVSAETSLLATLRKHHLKADTDVRSHRLERCGSLSRYDADELHLFIVVMSEDVEVMHVQQTLFIGSA